MMLSLFGFMNYLIIVKWLTDWTPVMDTGLAAPGVIPAMVGMFLQGGECQKRPAPRETECAEAYIISSQPQIMQTLLVVALVCVPIMLLVHPITAGCIYAPKAHVAEVEMAAVNHADNEGAGNDGVVIKSDTETLLEDLKSDGDHGHGFGDLFIHSMIETIEYALGTVSNTASYLRLWALSLAHSQLSNVFLMLTLQTVLNSGNHTVLFLMYYPFMGTTFVLILCVDMVECFLHTLRLHWVEFMNKFFDGQGVPFNAFNFDTLKRDVELE